MLAQLTALFRTTALGLLIAATGSAAVAGKQPASPTDTGDSGSTIFAVVNDAPITTYNIDQRAKLLSLDGGGWQQKLQAKLKAPDLQARFKAFAIAHNPKSKDEVLALQKTFVEGLKQQAIAETRPGLRDRAAAEILNETVQMQEAKRLGVLATDDDVKAAVTDIAQRNKKTLKEFEGAITATGVNLRAFKDRIKAQMSWQRVLEGRFRGQMIIGKAEVEQEIASAGATATAGGGAIQLKLQRITLPLKSGGAAASVEGYAAADALRQQAKPCVNFGDVAKSTPGARFDDLGMVSSDALSAEVKPMLISAEAGSVPPPVLTKGGIEIYGVCERGTVLAGDTATAAAKDKIQHAKLDALSHALLSDLCAAANIEPRNGYKLAKPCGTE